jgi:hypothetical protein
MWTWVKNLVSVLVPAESTGRAPPPPTPPKAPSPAPAQRQGLPQAGRIEHLMPIQWSLYYALSDAEWAELRRRHLERHPDQSACRCPKRCRTDTLDELWDYDHATATKRFAGGQWLCRGCHWLKSPTWRLQTWEQQRLGILRPPKKPPHINDCLGWTQEEVDDLKAKDLQEAERQKSKLREIHEQHFQGQLIVVPHPWGRLAPEQQRELRQTGKTILAPWDVDLSALTHLGYAAEEIERFTCKMLELGQKRLRGAKP